MFSYTITKIRKQNKLNEDFSIIIKIRFVIGESLSNIQSASKKLESFRKFIKLWHISREIIKRDSSSRIEDSLYKY